MFMAFEWILPKHCSYFKILYPLNIFSVLKIWSRMRNFRQFFTTCYRRHFHLNHRTRFKQSKHKNMQENYRKQRNYVDIPSAWFVWIEFSKNFHWMWIFINSSFADVFVLALFGTHWNYTHKIDIRLSSQNKQLWHAAST